jgi:hypothetical protein
MVDLYNPAQLDVLRRSGEIVRAMSDSADVRKV